MFSARSAGSIIVAAIALYGGGYYVGRGSGESSSASKPPPAEVPRVPQESSQPSSTQQEPGAALALKDGDVRLLAADAYGKKDWRTLELLLQNWAKTAPLEALAWTAGLPVGHDQEAKRLIVLAWLHSSPDAAIEWMSANLRGLAEDDRLYLGLAALGRWDLGIATLNTLPERQFMLAIFADAWAGANRPTLEAYFNQISGSDRLIVAQSLAKSLSMENFLSAVTWATANSAPGYERRILFEAIAQARTAADDIETILNWMQSSAPQGEHFDGVYRNLAQTIATQDPELALQLMENIHDPEFRSYNANVVRELMRQRPDLAIRLTEQTPNPRIRDQRLTRLVLQWAQKDIGAARRYANASITLSPTAKLLLLQRLSPPTP